MDNLISPLTYGISEKVKLVYGVGIKDINYTVKKSVELPKVNNKRVRKTTWMCPYYVKWVNMLQRSTYAEYKKNNKSYNDVTVCKEWLTFSNFVRWVDTQPNKDWYNCELDKDFLVEGNKDYHPETCCFISKKLNLFFTKKEGKCAMGVYKRSNGKYQAKCRSIYTGLCETLGCFATELEAHLVWQAKKHEHACMLADLQEDPRVAEALRQRYTTNKDFIDRG